MASLNAKDRVSLCQFTFSDGRRCRPHRFGNHPHLCPDHAQKEARVRAKQSLGKDLAHYFSGGYLSACDLSTAMGCLIPAVIRGDVKPKVARTVAYMAQTLLQAIHMAQHEYINAFDTTDWRNSIRNSVNGNHNYRFSPATQPEPSDSRQPQPSAASPTPPTNPPQPVQASVNCHSACPNLVGERSEEPAAASSNSPLTTRLPRAKPGGRFPKLPQSNLLSQVRQPLRPLAMSKVKRSILRRNGHPPSQIETPLGGTPATSTIPQTAISFRCNTYKSSPVSVDSKSLTSTPRQSISPLNAILTENRGWGSSKDGAALFSLTNNLQLRTYNCSSRASAR